MNSFLKKVAVFATILSATGVAFAGSQVGHVVNLYVRASDGLIYLEPDGTHNDRPSCASGHTYWIIKNETSASGKQQFAQLLTAKASGLQVTIWGANTCTRWSDGEDIDQILL